MSKNDSYQKKKKVVKQPVIYIEIPYAEGALESLSFIQLYCFAPSHLMQNNLIN